MGQSFESANKDGNKLDSFPELQSGWAFFFTLTPAGFLFPQCYFESAKRKMSGDSAATLPTGCCSVAESCPTLCDPLDCSTPGFPALHHLSEFILKLMSIESVMPSDRLNLCRPLLFLSSIFPHIRVFFSESALCTRWSKYRSFRINPEYSQDELHGFPGGSG